MFRPSRALLSQSRPSPRKLPFRLHHPPPLTAHEGRKLLDLLTTSFRSHLDAEHGQAVPGPGATLESSSPTPSKNQRPINKLSYTDRHLRSVLSNPLFDSTRPVQPRGVSSPMDIFERAVANGIADTEKAGICLRRELDDIKTTFGADMRIGMKQSGAGRKVLRWLTSSGAVDDVRLLSNIGFSKVFMQFLVAEGLHDAAWTLTSNTFKLLAPPSPVSAEHNTVQEVDLRHCIGLPLANLVKAEFNWGEEANLDKAYLCMEKASSLMNGVPLDLKQRILQPGLLCLVRVTLRNQGIGPPPSAERFESFLRLLPPLKGQVGFDIALAHLDLLHPTRPSALLALETLPQWPQLALRSLRRKEAQDIPKHVIRLGLATTKFLLENDRYSEADWTMQFLRENFSAELGEDGRRTLSGQAAEASSLEMLEDFNLA